MIGREEQVRVAFEAVRAAVREMTAIGSKPIPPNPTRFNLLAWRQPSSCQVCHLPGHKSLTIEGAHACRLAILCTIRFWEEMSGHILVLYNHHEGFEKAIKATEPVWDMRLDNYPCKGIKYEEAFVERLTCNYLKFQAHFAGIRAKAGVLLSAEDLECYARVTKALDEFLLKGDSCEFVR